MAKMLLWGDGEPPHQITYQSDESAAEWADAFRKNGYENVRVVPVNASVRARAHARRKPRGIPMAGAPIFDDRRPISRRSDE